MVFEALVSDVLNRFIGDYVENLDKSQLKIGIWGGEYGLFQHLACWLLHIHCRNDGNNLMHICVLNNSVFLRDN